jgi:hypothetical protein
MGMTYEAGVFFGVAFPQRSAVGKALDAYIDRYGGTPAPTGVAGVEIGLVGSQPTDEAWVTVQAKGSVYCFGRNDSVPVPSLLEEAPSWDEAICRFLNGEGIRNAPAVGWRFFGSVS